LSLDIGSFLITSRVKGVSEESNDSKRHFDGQGRVIGGKSNKSACLLHECISTGAGADANLEQRLERLDIVAD
jgi:hypothetical protein